MIGTFGGLDRRRGAVVALCALTDTALERLARAFAPRAVGGGIEVLLEIVGGAGLIVAEDDVNRLGGQRDARVERLDRRVVPLS